MTRLTTRAKFEHLLLLTALSWLGVAIIVRAIMLALA